ncbi:beta-propeller fold lactonase family protein [Streptomyces sp. NEAU-S77]|uniref:beta-propeller fold lactonase family protein n=1 Tax=Streptomyces sp. NEAU-S77 TaxID=3411033 RepID=UPI003B9E7832
MAGPRHICFHPTLPYAYAIDELRSTVTTYRWDAARGALEGVQTPRSTWTRTAGRSGRPAGRCPRDRPCASCSRGRRAIRPGLPSRNS